MSITILTAPQTLAFSKNPIIFRLHSNNYKTTEGVVASSIFQVVIETGDTFTIAWGDQELIFTSGISDNSGLKIPIYNGTDSDSVYSGKIATALEENPILSQYFRISSVFFFGTYFIYIQAKEAGELYSLTISTTASSFNLGSNNPGVDRVVRENFKIAIELYFDNGSSPADYIVTLQQDPDINSTCLFDLSDYLDKKMTASLPVYGYPYLTEATLKKYFVRYYEVYGDPPVSYRAIKYTSPIYAINGGMKKQDWPLNTLVTSLSSNSKRFLTWHPVKKEISTSQQEFLYYLLTASITTLQLVVELTFDDGSTSTPSVSPPQSSPAQYSIFIFPVGFTQLSLASYEVGGLTITKYRVWMADQSNNVISEVRTYVVDRNVYQNVRHILYQTSLGGFDTIRLLGEAQTSAQIGFDTSEKHLTPDSYYSLTGQREKINIEYEETTTVSTGYLEKSYKKALQDLLVAKYVYEIKNGKFVSIELQNKDVTIIDEGEDIHPLVLEYKDNFTNTGFNL